MKTWTLQYLTPSTVRVVRCASRPARRKGFILVMTLVLIAIAGIILAGLARHSLQLAIEAVDGQTELQRRWGSVCVEQVIFHNSKLLLERQMEADEVRSLSQRNLQVVNRLQGEIVLGDLTFIFQLADEEAKVNLNTLYRELPQQHNLEEIINGLMEQPISVLLRPDLSSGQSSRLPVFHSWGQVFEYERLGNSEPVALEIANAVDQLTCWGNGKLNTRTASKESLALVVSLALNKKDTQRLLERREEKPSEAIRSAANALGLRSRQRRKLLQLLSEKTSTYSMWLTISTPGQRWHEFHVARPEAAQKEIARFHW